ncbi:protein kinase [Roseibacillus persicicus]|uniref:protein kinase domain-containing protein n=1 Tax=Roseibacillus persicicus TaxID=454148 RepID=UPI00398AB63D
MIGDARYRVEEEIARGGMGVVLRVTDGDLGRTLAMKRMASAPDETMGGAEASRFARFMEEAQVTAQLDHPAIVPVHDLGFDEDGTGWYTMKLVEGRDLGQVFDLARGGKGGWTEEAVLRVLVQVCQALSYAHGKGVLHRDLKPTNIMVGEFGEVYVMDWGLARVEGSEVTSPREDDEITGGGMTTIYGSVMGTPEFMAPEQARGEDADERSDVYAVGAMMYHYLAGRPPYQGAAKDVVAEVVAGPPKPLPSSVRRELATICRKAMKRNRDERYQSVGALGDDLQRYLEGRVVQAHESGSWAEFKKWMARNKAVSWAMAAVFASLVTMLVLQNISKEKVLKSEAEAVAALEGMAVSQGLSAGKSMETGEAAYWFREAARRATDETRAQTHRLRARIAAERQTEPVRALQVPFLGEGHCRIDFSPNGAFLLASQSVNGGLQQVVDIERERLMQSSTGGVIFKAAAFCAKTGRVALAPEENPKLIEVWSSEGGRVVEKIEWEGAPIGALAFSPDGGSLFVGAEEGKLYDFGRAAFSEKSFEHVPGRQIGYAVFAPKGDFVLTVLRRQIVLEGEFSGLRVFDVAGDGKPLYPMRECWFWANLANPGFLKGGDTVVYYLEEDIMETMITRTGAVVSRFHEIPTDVRADPEDFVYRGGDSSRKGSERKIDEMMGEPRFRPHHDSVLANRPGLRELSWKDGSVRRPVGLNRFEVRSVAVSPDGMLAAGWETCGLLRFWSLRESEWQFAAEVAGEVRYSPSGQWITDTSGETGQVYEAKTGEKVGRELVYERESVDATFSPNERELAVSLTGGRVEFWDWRKGTKSGRAGTVPGEVLVSEYAPGGEWVAVMCRSGELCRVEGDSGLVTVLIKHEKMRESVPPPDSLKRMEFSQDGRWLVVWSSCEGILIWDCQKGEPARTPPVKEGRYVSRLKLLGDRIVFLEEDHWEQIFDLKEWSLSEQKWTRESVPVGRGFYANIDVSDDGSRILLSRVGEEFASLAERDPRGEWQWRKIRALGRATSFFVPGTPFAVGVTSSGPSRFMMVDLRDGRALASPVASEGSIFQFPKLSPDRKSLAAVDWSGSGLAKVWDISVLTESSGALLDSREDRLMLSELNAGGRAGRNGWEELKGARWLNQWAKFRKKYPKWHVVPRVRHEMAGNDHSKGADLTRGLLAHWSFEGNSRNERSAGGGESLDLKIHGQVEFSEVGLRGRGARFDGRGAHLETQPILSQLSQSAGCTLSAWFRVDEVPRGAERGFIFETAPHYTLSLGLRKFPDAESATAIEFRGIPANQSGWGISNVVHDEDITKVWSHCVMTMDAASGVGRVFVNGSLFNEMKFEGNLAEFDRLYLGTYRGADKRFFKGMQDEVSLWDRALSVEEVVQLYGQMGRVTDTE